MTIIGQIATYLPTFYICPGPLCGSYETRISKRFLVKQFAFDTAKQIRLLSDCPTKMGAALERGGRILGVACNKKGSMAGGHWEYSRHAEIRLLLRSTGKGADLYLYREHGLRQTPLLAKPCSICTRYVAEAGIRRVYFTVPGPVGWESYRP